MHHEAAAAMRIVTVKELRDALSQYPDAAAVHCDSYFVVVSHDGRYRVVAELPAPEDVDTETDDAS